MSKNPLLRSYPTRRISPFDGMSVTSDVWHESHSFHLMHQRLHTLNSHGIGIVRGLNVIASSPASQRVYIMPGLAIDPEGNIIVVSEPTAYDLGQFREGMLHMLITYDESPPQSTNGRYGDHPFYVNIGFNVEAVIDKPDSPQIELARIHRDHRGATVTNPADAYQPKVNEIDMRFRPEVVTIEQKTVLVGVHYLSDMAEGRHGSGLKNLARSLNRQPELRIWIDDDMSLKQDLDDYDLICLVAKDDFQVEVDEINSLTDYLQMGGTLFLESCHQEGGANPASDRSFGDLVSSLGGHPEAITMGHDLLSVPHLFARPPHGFETQGAPAMRIAPGIIVSTYDFGCLWQGNRRSGPASREEIRAGMEWGENLIRFALERRDQTRSQANVGRALALPTEN